MELILIILFVIILCCLLLIAGAGLCIDEKCPPIQPNGDLLTLKCYLDSLTDEQQKEFFENIKDPDYCGPHADRVRRLRGNSCKSENHSKVPSSDIQ